MKVKIILITILNQPVEIAAYFQVIAYLLQVVIVHRVPHLTVPRPHPEPLYPSIPVKLHLKQLVELQPLRLFLIRIRNQLCLMNQTQLLIEEVYGFVEEFWEVRLVQGHQFRESEFGVGADVVFD